MGNSLLVPQKLNMKLPFIPTILLLGICPTELETGTHTDTCTFIAAVFTTAQRWKQPTCPPVDECLTPCGTFIQWNIRQPWRGVEYWYLLPSGHTSKTSCWVTEARHKRPHIAWFSFCGISRTGDSMKTECRRGGRRGQRGGRNGVILVSGGGVLLWSEGNVLEVNRGHGCITLQTY